MRILFPIIVLLLIDQTAIGQKSPLKFGHIPMEDLKMTDYQGDSSVSAVMLLQYGEATVNLKKYEKIENGDIFVNRTKYQREVTDYLKIWYVPSLIYKKHVRIKILTAAGAKQWRNIQATWAGRAHMSGEFLDINGVTYNLENGIIVKTPLTEDEKFDEKVTDGLSVKKVVMPNVKAGSIIEYTYSFTNTDWAGGLPEWQFQWDIPVRESEYWTNIPDSFDFTTYMQGVLPVDIFETSFKVQNGGTNKLLHIVMHNVPAFNREPFMTSEDEYVSKINFVMRSVAFPDQDRRNLLSSWSDINDKLIKDEQYVEHIKGNRFLKDVTESLLIGIDDPMKKIQTIHSYIRNNIQWNDRITNEPGILEKVFKEKRGSSADINFMFASMLDKAGLVVDMVFLSTREHGMIRKLYPDLAQFNYVVCAVRLDGTPLLYDATDRHLPPDLLPERCLNGEGFIISPIASGWIEIKGTKSTETVAAELSLGNDGGFSGRVTVTLDGYNALSIREASVSNGENSWLEDFSKVNNFKIEKSAFTDMDDVQKPVKATLEVQFADEPQSSPDVIYLNPNIAKTQISNPFESAQRTYPVNFGHPFDQKYFARIIIPEGYYVDVLPKSTILRLEDNSAKFTFNTNVTPQFITITSALQISKSLFNAGEYPHLREFYNQMLAKQAEMIVLKKK